MISFLASAIGILTAKEFDANPSAVGNSAGDSD
jgi:hypothetical protein